MSKRPWNDPTGGPETWAYLTFLAKNLREIGDAGDAGRQARRLIREFQLAHRRAPATGDELRTWYEAGKPRPRRR